MSKKLMNPSMSKGNHDSSWKSLKKNAVMCSLLLWSFTLPVKAETSTHSLTFTQALQKVQQYQTGQDAWQTQEQISAANIKQSKLWKNPELSIQQSGFDSKNERELSVGLSQPLDIFGERKANQRLAHLSKNQLDLKQKIYQAQLQLAVKYLWSQLAISELENNVVREQLKVSEANLNAVNKRYQAGSVAQVQVDRARLSHAENARLAHQADLKVQVAKQQLSNLWGDSDKSISTGLSASSLWPTATNQQVQAYLAENLVEKSRQLQVLEAQAKVDQLQIQSKPLPTVNVGMNQIKSPQTQTDNQIVVGVSVPLNIFNRQKYSIEIVKAKENLLNKQQIFYARQNALQIGTLLTELQGLEAQFKKVEQVQLPLASQVQSKTLLGFNAGKFEVTDVQQATLQLQEVRLRKVQLLREAWQLAIEAESLSLGIEPSQVIAKDAIAQINQNLWQDIQALPVVGGEN